ncbi:UPF0481 protein [Ananas comosus]|uniref:UPF0481 protein n=1 Tax=Ananas comosus TaxID=4615 RepID=A0A199UQ69_ANACO|nr:UPF0481 protein [Ananas comosus]
MDELVISMKSELSYYWSLGENLEEGTKLSLIYKIPKHIREADRNAYEPIILSIGPYHHSTPAVLAMEKVKWNCLDYILKLNRKKTLQDYVRLIMGLADQVRKFYSEEIKIETDKYLEMLLLDGCFILVYLYGTDGIPLPTPKQPVSSVCQDIVTKYESEQMAERIRNNEAEITENNTQIRQVVRENLVAEVQLSEGDAIHQSTQNDRHCHDENVQNQDYLDQIGAWYTNFVAHDLLLLENQLPFFVIKRIYELVASKETATPLAEKIAKHVERMLCYYPKAIRESRRPKDFHHLLHLCHMYFRPTQKLEYYQHETRPGFFRHFKHLGKYFNLGHHTEEEEQALAPNQQFNCLRASKQANRWHRAVQYYEAGVEFSKKEFDEHNPHSLLDIKFSNGVMEIPCLRIDENTGSLFRNFIAFEQTCSQFGNDITAYIVFMSQLISMPDDVTLLVQRGIIVHILDSDEEVSTLFSKLSKDVVFDFNGDYYLKPMSWVLEEHYQSRLKRWMAWLWHERFSNPWLGLAVLTGAIVLFCTVLQTLIAVSSYYSALSSAQLGVNDAATKPPKKTFHMHKESRTYYLHQKEAGRIAGNKMKQP